MTPKLNLSNRFRKLSDTVMGWFESLNSWLAEERALKVINLMIAFAGLLVSSRTVFFGKDAMVFGPRLRYVVHEQLTAGSVALNGCTVTNEGKAHATNVTIHIWSDDKAPLARENLTLTGAEGQWEIEQDSRHHFYISLPRLASSQSFRVTVETEDPTDFHCSVVGDSGLARPTGEDPFRLLPGDFAVLLGAQVLLGLLVWFLRSRR